jgi:DNA-binding transcriptional MerR regulator/methylmalonyl-CoA mutase cobalamin-binding subunit
MNAIEKTPTLFSIGKAEKLTGLSKDTLRAWERRYGFPVPLRDERGRRAYDEPQLQRLCHVAELIAKGVSPAEVVPVPADPLVLSHTQLTRDWIQAAAQPEHIRTWIALLRRHAWGELRSALQAFRQAHGLQGFALEGLLPLCSWVIETRAKGDLQRYETQLFVEHVQPMLFDDLITLRRAASAQGPRVVLASPAGTLLSLNLMFVECLLAVAGCEVWPLDLNQQPNDIASAAKAARADVLAMPLGSLMTTAEAAAVTENMRRLLPPSCELWVGGRSSVALRPAVLGPSDPYYVVWTAQDLTDNLKRIRGQGKIRPARLSQDATAAVLKAAMPSTRAASLRGATIQ